MRNGLVQLPEPAMARRFTADGVVDVPPAAPQPQPEPAMARKDPKKAYGETQADKEKPGTFKVCGANPHYRTIPGRPEQLVVKPGQEFTCDGAEAAMCRQDGEKFKEVK